MGKRKRQKPTKPIPYNGDMGTGTRAATAGTVVEALTNDDGSNPNHMGRRRVVERYEDMGLSLRQYQAAKEIRDAWCEVQMQSSGGPLKEQVDASPRPDETIAEQTDAQSRLERAMRKVPNGIPRRIVEAICWNNQDPKSLPKEWANVSAQFKITLDLVANHLRY